MTTHSWFTGPYKNNDDEPDGWRRGELNGRFTPRSSGVGKMVERYPTQVSARMAMRPAAALAAAPSALPRPAARPSQGVQYPFSSAALPATEPLAHRQSPALDAFPQPAIWLQLGEYHALPAAAPRPPRPPRRRAGVRFVAAPPSFRLRPL